MDFDRKRTFNCILRGARENIVDLGIILDNADGSGLEDERGAGLAKRSDSDNNGDVDESPCVKRSHEKNQSKSGGQRTGRSVGLKLCSHANILR